MPQAVVTARVDQELSDKLDRLAGQLGRSRSWLTARALESYVEQEAEYLASIQRARDEIARGEGISEVEMDAFFDMLCSE